MKEIDTSKQKNKVQIKKLKKMKTKESIKRNKDYYEKIIKEIIARGVITSRDLKQIIVKVEGISYCSDNTLYAKVLPDLRNILEASFEEVPSGKGRGKVYSISGLLRTTVMAKLEKYFAKIEAREKVSKPAAPVKEPVVIEVKEKKSRKRVSEMNKRGYKTLIGVLRILSQHNGTISAREFRDELSKHKLTRTVSTTRLNSYLTKRDVNFRIDTFGRTKYIFAGNVEMALAMVSEEYQKLFKEEVDNSKYLSKKSGIAKAPEVIVDNSQLIWLKWCLISSIGVIQENTKSIIDIENVCAIARNWRYETISTKRAIELLREIEKQYPGSIEIGTGGRAVRLKDASRLRSIFDPKNQKESILVRAGLSLEQMKNCFKNNDVKIESKISEFDNIYSIVIDKSYKCERDLISFYHKFRGTDQFLGCPELVARLNDIINQDRKRFELLSMVSNFMSFEN